MAPEEAFTEIKVQLAEIKSALDADRQKIDSLYVKILGNGDPTKGISYMVYRSAEILEEQHRNMDRLKSSGTSAVFSLFIGMAGGLMPWMANSLGII